MKHTTILQLTASLLTAAMLSTPALALGPTEDIKSGIAVITLDSGFVSTLTTDQTTITKVAPASFNPGQHIVTVPITGGAFDLGVAESDIITGGGFKLTKGVLTVTFSDIIVTLPDDPTKAEVSALVTTDGAYIGRIPIGTFNSTTLNIATPVPLPPNKKIAIHNIPLKLTTNAAIILNNSLSMPGAFAAGESAGFIQVTFKVAAKTF